MMMLMVVFMMFVMMFMLATMLMFVMMCHNSFLLIFLRCKGTQNVMQLGCKPLLVKVFATELHEISKKNSTFVPKSIEHGHRQICKAA